MGGFVRAASSFISPPQPKPAPVAPVVAAKPVVAPGAVVKASAGDKEASDRKKSIKRGVSRRRVPKSVMGSSPTETKMLLGE